MNDSMDWAPRQQQLVVTVLALFCREEPIAISKLIELLEVCGVESSAVRSSVSRLKKRGLLRNERRGRATLYAPSRQMLAVFEEGDEQIFSPARASLEDPWLLAAFTVPESQRNLRHRIRTIFTKRGAGSVTPGLWIAPAVISGRIRQELDAAGLTEFVDFFDAHYLDTDRLRAKVASWWDLGALASLYERFLERWEPVLDDVPDDGRTILCDYVNLLTQWRRLPYLDPGLPLELLPEPWPAQRAVDVMESLRAQLAEAAQAYVASVIQR